ncbi:MAG: substrate-binding domain-containing protein [Treponema sp.]|nr:substrate-binding domain-containing protein [Treponema sp.]
MKLKMPSQKKKSAPQLAAVALTVLTVIILCLYSFYMLPTIASQNDPQPHGADRSHHVLILGESADEDALREIYRGAEAESRSYDCVVELNVPSSLAEDQSLQSMLDFASFVDADGVIAYIGEGVSSVRIPRTTGGREIPLITVSRYDETIPQISHIGTNYSELGKKIAEESVKFLNGSGRIIIINTVKSNSANYSNLMASVTGYLDYYNDIDVLITDLDSSTAITDTSSILARRIRYSEADLLVCLSSEDSIRAAQLVNDLGKSGYVGIIGFGEGSVLDRYLEIGVITELISIDSQKIGSVALRELFEYIHYGHANSYIAADVKVRWAEEL